MKKIGFLSFGHYRDVPGARVRTAGDSLRQSIELAVAAEQAGMDGAWFRVHHFDRSLGAPTALLAAAGARTSTIDLGTGVVDMRYENPLVMAENIASADLISEGRVQLGVSRGSPEPAIDGQAAFGLDKQPGERWDEVARGRAERFRQAVSGVPMAHSQRAATLDGPADLVVEPQSPGLDGRIWWGAGTIATGEWAAEEGYHLLSSTLLLGDDGRPFHVQQAEQIRRYRDRYAASGRTTGGLAAVTRPVFPITNDDDRRYFAAQDERGDGRGILDNAKAVSGPTIAGSLDHVADRLSADEAASEADYVLFALPSQLGVEYNTHLFENLVALARALGWK